MAEVLGIISAVAGVAEVGCKLSILLYTYSHAVACPDKVIESIQPEVSLISAVLKQLESSLKDDENVRLCKIETLQTTEKIAVACRKALTEVEDLLRDYFENQNITLLNRLKRYNVEKKVNLLRANLDRLKSTLILMLEVIKYARSIIKHENKHKERDRETLVALQKANDDAALRYQGLLKAIESNGISIVDQFSKLGISTSNNEVSQGSSQKYAVVDKNGIIISGESLPNDLALKLEAISQLINEVEETQSHIAEVTEHSDIWETLVGTGNPHFRHTVITKHPQMPGIERARGHTSNQHPIGYRPKVKDVYIGLVGPVGAGKSTFVNVCCDGNHAAVSQGPGHCTDTIRDYHFKYTADIRVHLIDTPGFSDGHRSEREILTDLMEWMSQSHGELTRLSGILYFHRISDSRMQSSAYRNLRMFEKLCGADSIHSVILVTTHWGVLGDKETELQREQEIYARDDYWGLMMQHDSSVTRHDGSKLSAKGVLGTFRQLDLNNPSLDHHGEPGERRRGFSESSIEFQSAEQKVDQLLAQYTTVLDFPPAQQRRWTMDVSY